MKIFGAYVTPSLAVVPLTLEQKYWRGSLARKLYRRMRAALILQVLRYPSPALSIYLAIIVPHAHCCLAFDIANIVYAL